MQEDDEDVRSPPAQAIDSALDVDTDIGCAEVTAQYVVSTGQHGGKRRVQRARCLKLATRHITGPRPNLGLVAKGSHSQGPRQVGSPARRGPHIAYSDRDAVSERDERRHRHVQALTRSPWTSSIAATARDHGYSSARRLAALRRPSTGRRSRLMMATASADGSGATA